VVWIALVIFVICFIYSITTCFTQYLAFFFYFTDVHFSHIFHQYLLLLYKRLHFINQLKESYCMQYLVFVWFFSIEHFNSQNSRNLKINTLRDIEIQKLFIVFLNNQSQINRGNTMYCYEIFQLQSKYKESHHIGTSIKPSLLQDPISNKAKLDLSQSISMFQRQILFFRQTIFWSINQTFK
jgi:hypothetical protein